ncbi:MAG TPA: putative metal-binding motif-containing protein [Candidatus Polarisedimenticolaceae bacterium]
MKKLLPLLLLLAGTAPTQALEFSKTIDRRFPAFMYCPIDNQSFDLTFTAESDRVRIRISGANYAGTEWLQQRLDNMVVVEKAVFDANRILTPGFEDCYISPGPANYPGYNWTAAGTTEKFLDLFDANASAWDLTNFGFYDNGTFASAPRNPVTGGDRTGGALALGRQTDGSVNVSTDFTVTGLTPGQLYVLTGWWYVNALTPLTVTFNTNPCTDADGDGVTDCGGDCNDRDPKIYPGAAEVCEGRDNDCDGSVDEGTCDKTCDVPAKQGGDLRITTADFLSERPAIAWNGVDYALVWKDSRNGDQEIWFTRVTPSGTKVFPEVSLTGACSDCVNPKIAWNGAEYGVVWSQGGAIQFRRFDRNGAPIGAALPLNDPAGFSADDSDIVWTGSEFGVVWNQWINAIEIRFARLARDGALKSRLLPVTDNSGFGGNAHPRLAWNGTVYGIAWEGDGGTNQEIFFARMDPRQGLLGKTQITNHGSGAFRPHLAWTGTEWGLVWEDNRTFTEIYFQRVTAAGAETGAELRVTTASGVSKEPSLSWTGSEYGVFWGDDRTGDPEIWFGRITSAGAKVGVDQQITTAAGTSQQPAAAYAGSKYGVAFNDDRFEFDQEILFLRLGCDCTDADLDGRTTCVECDDARAAVYPGAAQVCDGFNNDCNDAAWPLPTGTNEADGDGDTFSACSGDCNDANAAIWGTPGEARSLVLYHSKLSGATTLEWTAPSSPGGTAPAYDTLRSTVPNNFTSSATCVESNDASNTAAADATAPGPGGRFFYLVRAENACPSGQGVLHRDSTGATVTGRACP